MLMILCTSQVVNAVKVRSLMKSGKVFFSYVFIYPKEISAFVDRGSNSTRSGRILISLDT